MTTTATATKYHFYRKVKEPNLPNLKYRDHSLGVVGYAEPQPTLDNYLGYDTVKVLENTFAHRGSRGARKYLVHYY